ncbi:hypothetical protein [Paludibacter sp. 221]|uniref:alpha/beta hydrolase n=1 Tax=Paludibacter sp. 221 TaxID=2302939 RepID=UPI0013D4A307|nr:hypothetical protein [Paludibacter sp. 221]
MLEKELKYPVILVHGIGAKDNKLFWGRIPEVLRHAGVKIFLGNTDSWAGIESNALALRDSVNNVLEICNAAKVNLIAHSKGGIDSRFLISTLGYAPKIASLTTISSPHLGSEIVDFISDKKYIHTKLAKKITYSLAKLYRDKKPDPYKILEDLTTKRMLEFNQNNPDDLGVYYCSYHSLMKSKFDDFSHFITYDFLKKKVGENDGIVSLKSSKWGEDFKLIEGKNRGGISHSEIVDIKRTKISGVDIPQEYLKIVRELKNRGF